jgi:hypothetical protein
MNPMDPVLRPEVKPTNALPASSRYYGSETATIERADGVTIICLRRRFIPPASQLPASQEHRVVKGDRLDNLAALYLGEPLLFWRIADANNAMQAESLTARPGRLLRVAFLDGGDGLAL